MIRHSNPPGQPLTALYLLHVGSMDARLIGLSTERHWKHQVKLASALNEAEVVLVDCDRPGIEAFGQNSGLGLSISRQIAEAHGGTLRAENILDTTGNRVGARFILTLPEKGQS